MVKRLRKVGNSSALILDKAIMELVGLEEGADVQLTVHQGSLLLTPVKPRAATDAEFEAAMDYVFKKRHSALKRLAE
jgi:antitoxin component of MazEF toxin-antitoxin module